MDKRGKTLLKVSIVFLVLISLSLYFVFALEGNTKTYDEETKTITIKNGIVEIATIQLNTPLVYNVIRGKDRLVAEFTINNFNDYSNVFNDMEFYDIKNNMKKFDREFNYKYKTFYDIEVPDHKTICKERLNINGSIEKYDCYQNQTGSHIEQRFNWNDFNKKAELLKGEITLGVFTDVLSNERVEWIPTLFGVRIDEWAEWTESLNIGLVSYYKLDEISGTVIDAHSDNNGSNEGATPNVTGLINTAYDFSGTTQYINLSTDIGDDIGDGATDMSFSLWFKADVTGANDGLFSIGTFVGTMGEFECSVVSDYIYCWIEGVDQFGTVFTDASNWHHLVMTFNGSDALLYLDSVNEANQSHSGSLNCIGMKSTIGAYYSIDFTFDGDIDEVGIWNRTLTASEVSDLWNDGEGITYGDTTPPNITINTPLNQTYATTTIVFNVTAVDETAMDSCLYSLNSGITNYTMTNISSEYTDTNSSMVYGSHTVTFYCNDTSNNINNSEQITFTINTPPTTPVQLLPANDSGHAMESTIIFAWENSTDADSNTITYDLEIYNKSDMSAENLVHSNTSISEGAENTSISIKLSDHTTIDGDYYWRVRAKDSLNNGSWSSNWTFQYANWTITFNISRAGESIELGSVGVSCSNGWDSSGFPSGVLDSGDSTDDVFSPGSHNCTFTKSNPEHYTKTEEFVANGDNTIYVTMSKVGTLTAEEHTWLEAIHECIVNKNCDLYNLLLEMNETIGNVWEHTTQTDESVVLSETITNKIVNSTNNLTIDYSVYIPIKAGYGAGDYLPVRIGYFFLDINNETCYNQGERPEGVSDPYCQPLIIETIGPMGGTVNFTVELQPALVSEDNYTIKRTIDIDPNNVWINYGQDVIGTFMVTESLIRYGASVENTDEVMPQTTLSKITGAMIGAGQYLLSGWQLVVVLGLFVGLLIVIVISRTILQIKKK